MCMSGGGGSSGGKRLRTGQLATAQRGVSTSRVAGYDLQQKGWSEAVKTTVSTELTKPTKEQAKKAQQFRMANPFSAPAPSDYDRAAAALSPQRSNPFSQTLSRPTPKIGEKVILGTERQTGKGTMGAMGGFTAAYKAPKPGDVRKTTAQYAYKDASGKVFMDTVTSATTYKEAEYKARMEKNALQKTAVDDGSTARIKSRRARSGVANTKQASAFSSKRPKSGSLRIDTTGAQVSG